MNEPPGRIGLVDGSEQTSSAQFLVVLDRDAVVQLDQVVAVSTELPGGDAVTHYGIVTELYSSFEGASLPSDTALVVSGTLPAEHVRRAEVRVLRVVPEFFIAPHAGSVVRIAAGQDRSIALFEDKMKAGKLPLGLDMGGGAVYADMSFVDGRAGGHVSISGISGVATKTSYALYLLYQLLETEQGMDLLGGRTGQDSVRALVFNTKGEDLLHIDRPNSTFDDKPESREQWRELGVANPGPFKSVELYAPRDFASATSLVPGVRTRKTSEVQAYGWTPEQFVREQLLQFCFTAEDERSTQVGWVEQQFRIQMLRRLRRPEGDDSGAIVILDEVPPNTSFNPTRLAEREPKSVPADRGHLVCNFRDFIELAESIIAEEFEHDVRTWFGATATGTQHAFVRRIVKLDRRIGPLIGCGLKPISSESARLQVVDISTLHDDAQRFVVGALLERVWTDKQATGRKPLRFVVLDELNKYAPAQGFSPLKELLVDIAERGRSLGVLLIGAQQAASAVAQALPRNASLKVAGRLDASESESYRFLTPALRERASRFMPGTMVVSQPIVPEPIPIRFPFPPFATNPDEAAANAEEDERLAKTIIGNVGLDEEPGVDL